MRNVICLLLLAACELEPAPKQAPKAVTPPPAAAPTPAPTPAPPPAAPTPPTPPPPVVVQDACTDAAVRYVDIQITEAKDATLRQNLELEKARTIGRIEKGCRDQKWSDEITGCYKAAKTNADVQVCTKKLQPVPAAAPTPKKPPTPEAAPQPKKEPDATKKKQPKQPAAPKKTP